MTEKQIKEMYNNMVKSCEVVKVLCYKDIYSYQEGYKKLILTENLI